MGEEECKLEELIEPEFMGRPEDEVVDKMDEEEGARP